MIVNKALILRNPNNEEPENWHKFWKCFNTWINTDALDEGFLKDEYAYYNSNFNGGTYEFHVDYEKEYNLEYGESYPEFTLRLEYEDIKKYVEIAYKRWVRADKKDSYTKLSKEIYIRR